MKFDNGIKWKVKIKLKEIDLLENERIDDLQLNGLKIIQNNSGFCFGIDSVLLSEFAKNVKNKSNVVDLGTGTGILGFLLLGKTNINFVTGIEVQEEVAKMAERSIKLNKLEDRFKIINSNILDLFDNKLLEKNTYDVIITNPPYKEIGTGMQNADEAKLISRHEVKAKLLDFIKTASLLLKDKGEIYMVHKPERLVDIIDYFRKNKIEPKELRVVYSHEGEEATLILIKGVKGAKKFLKIDKPLYIYNKDGSYTEEIKKIYNK